MLTVVRRPPFPIVAACGIALLGFASAAAAGADYFDPRVLAAYGTAWIHIHRARAMEDSDAAVATEHWSQARDFLEYALSLDPFEPRIARPLFAVYLRLRMTSEAVAMLKRFPVGYVSEGDDAGLSLVTAVTDTDSVLEVYETASEAQDLPEVLRLAILLEAGAYCELKARHDRAAEFYERALALAPKNPVILAQNLLLLWNLRRYDRGIDLGRAYAEKQENLDDEQVLRILALLEGFFVFSGRASEGADFYGALQSKAPDNGEICARRLSLLWRAGRTDEMIETGDAFLARKEDEAVRLRLAVLLADAGRPDEAQKMLEPIWQTDDGNADRWRSSLASAAAAVAEAFTNGGDADRAVALLERLLRQPWIEKDPATRKQLLLELARARGEAGDAEAAARTIDEAARAFPGDPDVVEARSDLMWQAGDRDGAITVLRDFIASHPDAPAAMHLRTRLADRLERIGDIAAAIAALKENLAAEPEDPTTCNNLGYLYAQHDRHLDEAVRMIEIALRAEPHEPAYLDSLGWAKYKLALRRNDPALLAEAEEALAEAVRVAPNEAVLLDHYAHVLHALGRREEALTIWRQALEALRIRPDETLPKESVRAKISAAERERDAAEDGKNQARTLRPPAAAGP